MLPAPRLRVRPVPVSALSSAQAEALWALYAEFYDHVDRPTFGRDLEEKSLVFLGRDATTGEIVGFSTAAFSTHRHAGKTVGVYFSGDTIFRPRYWGQTSFHRAVVRELMRWRFWHAPMPLYWHLVCSGYRTYLTLSRNFPTHWPRRDHPTPPWERGLLDALGRQRFGAAWRAERGVVSADGDQPRLKAGVAPITTDLLQREDIAYFVRQNPGCFEGDELGMIARVDLRAVGGMARKWLRKAWRGRFADARGGTPIADRPPQPIL